MRYVIAPEYDFCTRRDHWRFFNSLEEAVAGFVEIIEDGRRTPSPKRLIAHGPDGEIEFPRSVLGPLPQREGDIEAIRIWIKLKVFTGCLIRYDNDIEGEYWLVPCEPSGRFWVPGAIRIGNDSDGPWVPVTQAGIELIKTRRQNNSDPKLFESNIIEAALREISARIDEHPSVPIWWDADCQLISQASLTELIERCR